MYYSFALHTSILPTFLEYFQVRFLKDHLSASQAPAGCNKGARISSLAVQRSQGLSSASGPDAAFVQSTTIIETCFRESH